MARCLFLRNGPDAVAGNNATIWFIPCIRTVLYNKSGSERTAAANYTTNTVKAEEIVEDLLGRILTEFDGANATVETSSYGIDHLAYREAVDAWKIFEDLLVFHPDNYWAAWERSPAGLYAFEWVQKPATVRFEADVVDGFNAPGSAVDLYNDVSHPVGRGAGPGPALHPHLHGGPARRRRAHPRRVCGPQVRRRHHQRTPSKPGTSSSPSTPSPSPAPP